ncbi:hypothetical protein Tco_0618718 [Tanacetum coccineum]
MTHPSPKRNMVPKGVLMKSGLVSVNTAHTKATVNSASPMVNTVKDKNVNAIRPKAVVNAARPKAVVNVVKGNNVNSVKASACGLELELMLVKTMNGEVQLQALVDGKKIIITKASVRRDLQLNDEEDEAVSEKMDDSLERAATTTTSLDTEQDRGNINKTQSKATLNEPSSLGTSLGSGPRRQETMGILLLKLARIESSEDEGLGEEDASKQGRIDDIDTNKDIYLVNVHRDKDNKIDIPLNAATLLYVNKKLQCDHFSEMGRIVGIKVFSNDLKLLLLRHGYAVSSLMDKAYWSSE